MTEETPSTANDEMTYDPTSYNNEERVPISERLASQNQVLGEEAVKLAETEQELDGASLARKIFDPEIWKARSEWKELKDNPQRQEELKQTAEKYLPTVHGEALDYVAGYDSYLHSGELLSGELGVHDSKPLTIEEFIAATDNNNGKGYGYDEKLWYKIPEKYVLPTDEAERRKYFERSGAAMAAKDILTPPLEVKTYETAANLDLSTMREINPPRKFDVEYSELPGRNMKVTPGGRFPRLELSLTEEDVKSPDIPSGKESLLAIKLNMPTYVGDGETRDNITIRYIPLSEETAQLFKSMDDACNGSVKWLERTQMRSGASTLEAWGTVSYEFSVITPQSSAEDHSLPEDLAV